MSNSAPVSKGWLVSFTRVVEGFGPGPLERFDGYRGLVWASSRFSLAILFLATLLFFLIWWATASEYPPAVALTFWSHGKYMGVGIFVLSLVAAVPVLIGPGMWGAFRGDRAVYYLRRTSMLLCWLRLLAATTIGLAAGILAVPALVLFIHGRGIQLSKIYIALGLPSAGFPLLFGLQKLLSLFKKPDDNVALPLFEFPLLHPQRGQAINLDMDLPGPRLGNVARAFAAWNKGSMRWVALAIGDAEKNFSNGRLRQCDVENVGRERWGAMLAENVRTQLANLFDISSHKIVFIANVTRAFQIVLELFRPTVIVTTDQEHPWIDDLLAQIVTKFGTRVERIPLRDDRHIDSASFAEWFAKECQDRIEESEKKRKRAKAKESEEKRQAMVLMSHVCSATGWILPVRDIYGQFRTMETRPIVVVDGSNAVGQIEMSFKEPYSDFYVFCGEKWLYAPHTIGILVCNQGIMGDSPPEEQLQREVSDPFVFPGTRLRLEGGFGILEPMLGLAATLSELTAVPEKAITKNVSNLSNRLRRVLQGDPDVTIVEDRPAGVEQSRGILNLQARESPLDNKQLERVRNNLERKTIMTRVVSCLPKPVLRLCLPFYLRADELEKTATAIKRAFREI